MPTYSAEMEKHFIDRFQAVLEEKWVEHACPICGTSSWANQGWAQVHGYGGGLPGGDGKHWPLGVVMCRNCGYTVFMAVSEMGEWIEEFRSAEETHGEDEAGAM